MINMQYAYLKIVRVIFFFVLSITIAYPQIPGINSIIQETLTTQAKERENTLPDPAYLSPSWFHYIEGQEGAELKKRIALLVERIELQASELSADRKKLLAPTINHIKSNLETYASLRDRVDDPVSTPTLEIASEYNLSQIMDLYHSERDLAAQERRFSQDIDELDKQVKSLRKQIDNSFVRLIDTNITSFNRYVNGLNIIWLQTEIALIEQRLEIQKKALAQLEIRLKNAQSEKEEAIKRLRFNEEEFFALDKAIEESTKKIEEVSARLIREQSQFLVVLQDSAKDKGVSRIRAQGVLRTKVNLASLETNLLIYENKKTSLSLLNDDLLDFYDIQKELSQRYINIQSIITKMKDWLVQNEFERTQVNTYLAEMETKTLSTEEQFLVNLSNDHLAIVQETSVLLQKLNAETADALFLMKIIEDQMLTYQGRFMHWVTKTKTTLSFLWRGTKQNLRSALFKVGDTPITALSFAKFIVIVFVCWWVAYWLNKFLYRFGNSRGGEKLPIYYLIGRLVYYGIILFGFLYALTVVGIDFTNFALVVGALAIGLGFGLQSIVNNFVSGLILLFERSIKVGDFIELQDKNLWGEVKAINVRATIIRDNDNIDIIIPNSELISTKILNWTLEEPNRRVRYSFKVAYGEDKDRVREAILAAAEALPHTLKGIPGRNPAVWLTDFGEFCYKFELVVWLTARAVKRPNGVRAAYLWAIDSALREYNIEIPVPQREHRFREGQYLPLKRYIDEAETYKQELNDAQEDLFDEHKNINP